MFKESIDHRLSEWFNLRKTIEQANDPLDQVWKFWARAPFVPYNPKIDPFYQYGWPSPWEIIVENKYDDFTKALMIGWTLKLTEKFKDNKIEIKTFLDKEKPSQYNVVCVDNEWAINYSDFGPVPMQTIPESFSVENVIELKFPR